MKGGVLAQSSLGLSHCPVLLAEMIENLRLENDKNYLDCTFGAGGYTQAILDSCNSGVTAIDQDPHVIKYADKVKGIYGKRFEFLRGNFVDAASLTGGRRFDGIVLDLGVSSMQLDEGERGFSFARDGELDMRMSASGYSAADFLATASEEEIANVIYRYGDEVQSRRIAKKIVEARQIQPIVSTLKLAEIVRNAKRGQKARIDPATKTFQAIRIHINRELENLENFLGNLHALMKPHGRILIVSFHSGEDSIVKAFFRDHSAKKVARSKYARQTPEEDEDKWLKILSKKPIMPSGKEIKENPRSRSARLRVAENTGRK